MRITMFAMLLLSPAFAQAQSIYKCRDAQGNTAYQSDPCNKPDKHWDYQTGAPTVQTEAERKIRRYEVDLEKSRRRDAYNAGRTRSTRSDGRVSPKGQMTCAEAKERRWKALDRLGVNRSYEASQRWDELVRKACK